MIKIGFTKWEYNKSIILFNNMDLKWSNAFICDPQENIPAFIALG